MTTMTYKRHRRCSLYCDLKKAGTGYVATRLRGYLNVSLGNKRDRKLLREFIQVAAIRLAEAEGNSSC